MFQVKDFHGVKTTADQITEEERQHIAQMMCDKFAGSHEQIKRTIDGMAAWDPLMAGYVASGLLMWSAEQWLRADFIKPLCLEFLGLVLEAYQSRVLGNARRQHVPPNLPKSEPAAVYIEAGKLLQKHTPQLIGHSQHFIWTRYEMGCVYTDSGDFLRMKEAELVLLFLKGTAREGQEDHAAGEQKPPT